MKIVNLTPHEITFCTATGTVLRTIPASGTVARVEKTVIKVGEIDGVSVYNTFYSNVSGLPEPQKGTVFIVSSLTAEAITDRDDVYVPSISVRDENGKILGCQGIGAPLQF